MSVIETFAEQVFINDAGSKSVRQSYRTRRGKIRYRYITLVSCEFCGDDFVPTRRGVHIYCSTSCRSRACKARKQDSKSYEERQSQLALQPAVEAEVLSPAPAAKPLSWDWTRTAENVVASGTVAFAQYRALEDMIVRQFNQLRAEIRQSEVRTTQRLQQLADIQTKKPTSQQPKGIDAMDFEEIARRMLE